MRFLRRLGIVLLAVGALAALGTLAPRPLFAPEPAGSRTRHILMIANPIHTDLALPYDNSLTAAFPWLNDGALPFARSGGAWVTFGWGSRAFYIETPTWSELRPGPLFKALTVDDSVLHVTVAGEIEAAHPAVTVLDLDEAAYQRLLAFIGATFVVDSTGRPTVIPDAAYGSHDAFFEAQGAFNALVGCNTWTARALRTAGFRTGWWNPLPQSLAISLVLYN